MAKWELTNNFMNGKVNGPTMYMKQKQMDMRQDIKAAADNLNEFLSEYHKLGGEVEISEFRDQDNLPVIDIYYIV